MRTREYLEKGEAEGRSLLDAMRDGELDGMQYFDGEIEKLVRAKVISMATALLYATNAGQPSGAAGRRRGRRRGVADRAARREADSRFHRHDAALARCACAEGCREAVRGKPASPRRRRSQGRTPADAALQIDPPGEDDQGRPSSAEPRAAGRRPSPSSGWPRRRRPPRPCGRESGACASSAERHAEDRVALAPKREDVQINGVGIGADDEHRSTPVERLLTSIVGHRNLSGATAMPRWRARPGSRIRVRLGVEESCPAARRAVLIRRNLTRFHAFGRFKTAGRGPTMPGSAPASLPCALLPAAAGRFARGDDSGRHATNNRPIRRGWQPRRDTMSARACR